MNSGFITAAWMCLALGQAQSDILYTNQRNHAIPVNVQESRRAEIREVLLFASTDQGRNWYQAGHITPDKKEFAFYTQQDGTYWLRVAFVNRQGVQEPDDRNLKNGPPDLKMVIDTLKPIIKSFQAQRVGDEVVVSWDVQEDNPDLSPGGMRLEYMIKNSLIEKWTSIPCQVGLQGKASFRPADAQPLELRLTVRDLAGNQSYSPRDVAGGVAAVGFVKGAEAPEQKMPPMHFPDKPNDLTKGPMLPPPPPPSDSVGKLPPPPNDGVGKLPPPPQGGIGLPPPPKENSTEKLVADSRMPPLEEKKVAPIQPPPTRDPLFDAKPVAHSAPARKPLPPLQYINQHQVMLEYELRRVGPSGIGGIEIWLTRDDGETWEPYAADEDTAAAPNMRQKRKFDFRDAMDRPFADGVYGLNLVVKSRAGLGKKPRPGDVPEIRIEIDTQAPVAQLYQPVPDPQHPDQVLIKWCARDKNLTATPIQLEYAEKREGPWQPIKLDLENTGRYTNESVTGDYSWKVPAGTPVQVYMRLRVRDKAGNEGLAVTPQPQFVDLTEPEGVLIGVQPQNK